MTNENIRPHHQEFSTNSRNFSLQILLWNTYSSISEVYFANVIKDVRASLEKREIIEVKLNDAQINATSQRYCDILLIAYRDQIDLSNIDIIKSALLANFVHERNEIIRRIPQLISELESFLCLAQSYFDRPQTLLNSTDLPADDFRLSQESLDLIYLMSKKTREFQSFVMTNFIDPTDLKKVRPNLRGYDHSFSNTAALLTLGSLMRVYIRTPENPIHVQRIKDYLIFLQYYTSGFDVIAGSLEVISEISPFVTYLALESVKSPFRSFELLEGIVGSDIPSQKPHLTEMYAKLLSRLSQIQEIIPPVAVTQLMAKMYNILAEIIRNAVKYCDASGISFDFVTRDESNSTTQPSQLQLIITITNNHTAQLKQSFASTQQGENILSTLITEINDVIPNMISVASPSDPNSDPYRVYVTITL